MPRYRYRAYDGRGAVTSGELIVDNRQTALQALARRSEIAIELHDASGGDDVPWWQREIRPRALSQRALAEFMRDLSGLVSANLPLDEALRIMAVQPAVKAPQRRLVTSLLERINTGASLSEAMEASDGAFPPYAIRLIGAGEISSNLESALADLARHLEVSTTRAAKLWSQLLYPCVLVVAAFTALAIITTVLVPAVRPLFEDAGVPPPGIIAFLSSVQEIVSAYGVLLAIAIGGLSVGLLSALRQPSSRRRLHAVLLELPFLGDLIRQAETARLSRTLAALVQNGVPLPEALHVSSNVLSNQELAAQVARIEEAVRRGQTLSAELQRCGAFPELLPRLTRLGEETGQLETMLIKVAETYDRAVEIRLDKFITLLTPALTILIGVVIGVLVVSVMNAILAANALVLQ